MYIYICTCVNMCVCVLVFMFMCEHVCYSQTHTHTHIYIYTYLHIHIGIHPMYMHVCMHTHLILYSYFSKASLHLPRHANCDRWSSPVAPPNSDCKRAIWAAAACHWRGLGMHLKGRTERRDSEKDGREREE